MGFAWRADAVPLRAQGATLAFITAWAYNTRKSCAAAGRAARRRDSPALAWGTGGRIAPLLEESFMPRFLLRATLLGLIALALAAPFLSTRAASPVAGNW